MVRLNHHLRQNCSIFMRNFKQNQHKLSNNHVQFSNQNLLCKFEPPSRKSWIRPCFYHLSYFIYMGQPIWDPKNPSSWVDHTIILILNDPCVLDGAPYTGGRLYLLKTKVGVITSLTRSLSLTSGVRSVTVRKSTASKLNQNVFKQARSGFCRRQWKACFDKVCFRMSLYCYC